MFSKPQSTSAFFAGVAAASLFFLGVAAEKGTVEENPSLSAGRIEILDSQGRARLVLGQVGPNDEYGLLASDAKGSRQLYLGGVNRRSGMIAFSEGDGELASSPLILYADPGHAYARAKVDKYESHMGADWESAGFRVRSPDRAFYIRASGTPINGEIGLFFVKDGKRKQLAGAKGN